MKKKDAAILAELHALDAKRESLLKKLSPVTALAVPKPAMALWVAISSHLQAVGGSDTLEHIIESLQVKGGRNLGKYPVRTIMNSVKSPVLRGMFTVEDVRRDKRTVQLITLKASAAQIYSVQAQHTTASALLH